MNNLENIFKQHVKKYPLMQPQDAVKLIYQSEFGGGHLITDINACYNRLKEEYISISFKEEPLYEYISPNMVRLNLCAAKKMNISPDAIFKSFYASTNNIHGSFQSFKDKLAQLNTLAIKGVFSFTPSELNEYIKEYASKGYPVVSHSEIYRKHYSPAYRIFEDKYLKVIPIIEKIEKLYNTKKRIIIAIDGKSASGKSTAANTLSTVYSKELAIIHMDDYFLPYELRTPKRYAESGGNIHYERFKKEIISNIYDSKLTYSKFDCSTGSYSNAITINLPKIVIVEGSYSLHPYFGNYYDVSVFSDISSEEQLRRIILRNGKSLSEIFKDKWIPLEEKYFTSYNIKNICDIII